jgi:hypothetical protein
VASYSFSLASLIRRLSLALVATMGAHSLDKASSACGFISGTSYAGTVGSVYLVVAVLDLKHLEIRAGRASRCA